MVGVPNYAKNHIGSLQLPNRKCPEPDLHPHDLSIPGLSPVCLPFHYLGSESGDFRLGALVNAGIFNTLNQRITARLQCLLIIFTSEFFFKHD